MSRWLAAFRAFDARSDSTISTDSSGQGPNGASGANGTRIETEEEAADRILAAAARAVLPELADDEAEITLRGEMP